MKKGKKSEDWEKELREIEEILFNLHIRFCPLIPDKNDKITQEDCNQVKEELKEKVHHLLQTSRQEGLTPEYIEVIRQEAIKDFLGSEEGKVYQDYEILKKQARKEAIKDFLGELPKEKSINSRDYDFGGETSQDRKHNEMRGMDKIFGFNSCLQEIKKVAKDKFGVEV